MKTSEIETALTEKREGQARLKSELDSTAERLSALKADYENAVRAGAAESELDKTDQAIFKLDRQRGRVQIRFEQCNGQIELLQRERESAHREEELAQYDQDVKTALVEAAELEATTQLLMDGAAKHVQTLNRLRKFCEQRGVGQIPYRLANLERRVQALFNGGHAVNKIYKESYPVILAGNIAAVAKQLNQAAPSSEGAGEPVHEAEAGAIN